MEEMSLVEADVVSMSDIVARLPDFDSLRAFEESKFSEDGDAAADSAEDSEERGEEKGSTPGSPAISAPGKKPKDGNLALSRAARRKAKEEKKTQKLALLSVMEP